MEGSGVPPSSAAEPENAEPAPPGTVASGEPVNGTPPEGEPVSVDTPPPPSRRRLGIVIAIVVVVVLVVLGLSFTGLLGSQYDLLAPRSPTSAVSVPFSQAYDAANGSVQGEGGSWELVSAEGFDIAANGPNPFALANTSSPCSPGTLPPFVHSGPGDPTKGLSPYWAFSFESTTNLSIFNVVVVSGQAQALGTTPPNLSCEGKDRAGYLAPPASIEDSPAAVASLPNLTGFVGEFPNTSVFFFLSDVGGEIGRVSGTAIWAIEASPCYFSPFAPGSGGDPVYIGETNGTTLHVYGDRAATGFGACETPGTLAKEFELNTSMSVTNLASGGWAYSDGFRSVNGTPTPASFHPAVYPGAVGSPPPAAIAPSELNFSVRNAAGVPVANYNFTTSSWTFGSSIALVLGDSMELESRTSLEADSLVLIANAPTTGQIGFFLP